MKKILIFGNSGSGKSTLANAICQQHGLAHLDMDTLAWEATTPPTRKALQESATAIDAFMADNSCWVIEGCYTDLMELVRDHVDEIIFMNLPIELCQANARQRPWEPHKYESKQAQDANLVMLLGWIADYPKRQDEFSQEAHQAFYDNFTGNKRVIMENK